MTNKRSRAIPLVFASQPTGNGTKCSNFGGVRVEFCAVFRVHLEIKVLFKLYSWFRRKEAYVVGCFSFSWWRGGGVRKQYESYGNIFEAGLVSVINKCWHCDPLKKKKKCMGLQITLCLKRTCEQMN